MPRLSAFPFLLSALILSSLPSVGHAESSKLKITFQGAENGIYTYEDTPDGGFHSSGLLKIGSSSVGGTLDGHIKNHLLTDFTGDNAQSGVLAKFIYDGKNLKLTLSSGKTINAPYEDKTGYLLGILHPQLSSYTLLQAEKKINALAGSSTTTMSPFIVEDSVVLPVKITMLEPKVLQVGPAKRTVKRFKVVLNGIEIVYGLDETRVVAMDIDAQKVRLIADGYDGLFVDPLAKYPELSQPSFKVKTELGMKTKMRDGVTLVSDIVRPDDNLKHPTILSRTPYGREPSAAEGPFWASRGYVFVSQDCRGRNDSEGEWNPFVHETNDGVDTINWIPTQSWSDGKVGMIGGSYLGFVQWAAAVGKPAALKCIVPQVSPPGDALHNLPYDFGIPFIYGDLWWAKIVAGKKADMSGVKSALPKPKGLTSLPISNLDEAVLGQKLEFYRSWMKKETLKDWDGWNFSDKIGSVKIPALHISGTWDGDEIGTQMNWDAQHAAHRKNQWIVFGPWTHAFNTTHSLGGEEYGPDAIVDLQSVYLRWFDTWLKGRSVGLEKVPHVKLFVTGANRWIEDSDWPSKKMTAKITYLAKDGLQDEAPANGSSEYLNDPNKDTVIPQSLIEMDESKASVKVDPSELKGKSHLLLKSAPFTKATAITGPFTTTLYFSTNAQDTDLYANQVDIQPDGTLVAIGRGAKIRASYLGGYDKRRALKPGKVYKAVLEHWNFAREFGVGHRLGLLITSSGFPLYARNLGTVEPVSTGTTIVPQKNVIYFGKDHPSHINYEVLWEK